MKSVTIEMSDKDVDLLVKAVKESTLDIVDKKRIAVALEAYKKSIDFEKLEDWK